MSKELPLPQLISAVKEDNLEKVTLWIGDINLRDQGNSTALHHAAVRHNKDIMDALLESKNIALVIDAKNIAQDTALYLALKHSNWTMAQKLIDKGAALPTWRHTFFDSLTSADLSISRTVKATLKLCSLPDTQLHACNTTDDMALLPDDKGSKR